MTLEEMKQKAKGSEKKDDSGIVCFMLGLCFLAGVGLASILLQVNHWYSTAPDSASVITKDNWKEKPGRGHWSYPPSNGPTEVPNGAERVYPPWYKIQPSPYPRVYVEPMGWRLISSTNRNSLDTLVEETLQTGYDSGFQAALHCTGEYFRDKIPPENFHEMMDECRERTWKRYLELFHEIREKK